MTFGESVFQPQVGEFVKAFLDAGYDELDTAYVYNDGNCERMLGEVLEILARKAKSGVDVRLMYDGSCEFFTMPRNYPELLKKLGIQCKVFSPATPFVSTHYNYRDHRKIAVIDGRVAFTGGKLDFKQSANVNNKLNVAASIGKTYFGNLENAFKGGNGAFGRYGVDAHRDGIV